MILDKQLLNFCFKRSLNFEFFLTSIQVKLNNMSEKDKQNALNEIRLLASV